MSTLEISPVQWSVLKDIDGVEPVNDKDAECLLEIRDVLRRHGKIERFGVALLHSHFQLSTDEILLESSDEVARTLVTTAVKKSEAGGDHVGTIYMLREGGITEMAWCRQFCKRQGPFNLKYHKTAHAVVK